MAGEGSEDEVLAMGCSTANGKRCDNCSEELEFEEKTDLELGAGARDLAIRDLKKKLASKKMAVALKCGQHAIRHYAVMQFPYYQRVVYLYDGTINVKIMVSAV